MLETLTTIINPLVDVGLGALAVGLVHRLHGIFKRFEVSQVAIVDRVKHIEHRLTTVERLVIPQAS